MKRPLLFSACLLVFASACVVQTAPQPQAEVAPKPAVVEAKPSVVEAKPAAREQGRPPLAWLGQETKGQDKNASSTVFEVKATAETEREHGIVKWRITARGNGDFGFEGLKANGRAAHWQTITKQGGGGNPWNIVESDSTLLASREDGTEHYAYPGDQEGKWVEAEKVGNAFVHDVNDAAGKQNPNVLEAKKKSTATGADKGISMDCFKKLAEYGLAVFATGGAITAGTGACVVMAVGLIAPDPGISKLGAVASGFTCIGAFAGAALAARLSIQSYTAAAQACQPNAPPGVPPPARPALPPGAPGSSGGGGEPYLYLHNKFLPDGTSELEVFTNRAIHLRNAKGELTITWGQAQLPPGK